MKDKITREEAFILLNKFIKEKTLYEHSIETEAVLRGVARQMEEDEELWGNTGLLHDLDYQETKDEISKHGKRTCELLREEGYEIPEMFQAVLAHTESLGGAKRESKLDFSLAASESITGLIVAYVLMRPDKKIEGAKVKSVKKKLKDKSFAANVNREYINDIEKAGLEKSKFIEIALESMKGIAEEIGL